GRGHFGLQGYNLNNFGRGSLDKATFYIPNIKDLGLLVSDKKIFKPFPYISLCKTRGHWSGGILGSRALI
ncbi:MAG: hypothetical protein N0E48_12815, partial [Candidatus Thiodiazotropha endolucinida]|nr:hypothetical protein [Candidatus Thiodiazotropha taylori]MCW4344212.1 hypothetical protein [Candidatus Thiodiazotropha endolucinida]